MLIQQLHVARVVGYAFGFEALDLRERALVHRRHQRSLGVGVVRRAAAHHVGDHEPLETLLMLQGVLDRQHAAPGVAEQVEVVAVESERSAYLLDLVDEAGDLPEVRIVRLVAPGRAELVVVVVLDPRPHRFDQGPVLDPRSRKVRVASGEVLVRRPGSTVQQEDLHFRVVADSPGPDAEFALRGRDRDQPDATGQDVAPAGVVEVASCWLHVWAPTRSIHSAMGPSYASPGV